MTVDFEDCLKDSPRFRAGVEEVETEVLEMELRLEKLVKLCGGMIEAGRSYISTNQMFISGVRELSQQCHTDSIISSCLETCAESLQEIVNYHMILFDQAQRSVKQQLQNFVKEDVRKFKDSKKQLERMREDLEAAQLRNAQAPRNKAHEVEEATSSLSFSRKCFRHLALDYVLQINVLQAKKKFEILDAMLSFMQAQFSLYEQSFGLLQQIQPFMKGLAAQLDQLVVDAAVEKREMEHKHASVQQQTLLQDFACDEWKPEWRVADGPVMEGYLFKRASNTFKTWNRRWFSIQKSQLVYQKKLKDSLTVVVEDLRLCSVKPCEDLERRFCFEVASPSKSCMLQAESEKLRVCWIQAVQTSIATAYRESSDDAYLQRLDRAASPSISSIESLSESRERAVRADTLLRRILSLPGNQLCCDCGQRDPRWASINLGVLLCIECSGIHRSLGVHCSKVRSLMLDSWEPELLKLICELGNAVINRIYEGGTDALKKPTPSSSRQEKEAWIKAKYVHKSFLKKMTGGRRKMERRCRRHNSSTTVPATRRRHAPPTTRSAAEVKFRRDSLFCPDELDTLFSYFDTGSGPRSPAGLSSDSGLGGSTDVLVFESVVDSVEEECEASEDSSNGASDTDDVRELAAVALLHRACRAGNLPVMAASLAHGAEVNAASEEDEGKSALIQAVIGGSLVACEFLLQNGADVNQRDQRARAPLHHATYLSRTGQVCLLLKRGATQSDGDEDGHDPLSIAVQAANADIVTLLRLARMNEEMRESEGAAGSSSVSPTEQQYRKCIQEFISLHLDQC